MLADIALVMALAGYDAKIKHELKSRIFAVLESADNANWIPGCEGGD